MSSASHMPAKSLVQHLFQGRRTDALGLMVCLDASVIPIDPDACIASTTFWARMVGPTYEKGSAPWGPVALQVLSG